MEQRPAIGVTTWGDVPPEARERYRARVIEAGGEVVDLGESEAARESEVVGRLDALVLTGGIDMDPARYGAARHPKVKEVDPARDAMELAALEEALRRDIPVLAICRGHQVLNVGFGGALLQHVESGEHRARHGEPGSPSRWHTVELEAGSPLAEIYETTKLHINSRHHQAVTAGTLAPALRALGFASDHEGPLVEAMQSTQHRWVIGVQWHPERPEPQEPSFAPLQRRLYAALIAEARKVRA